jgi:hypothetical protein
LAQQPARSHRALERHFGVLAAEPGKCHQVRALEASLLADKAQDHLFALQAGQTSWRVYAAHGRGGAVHEIDAAFSYGPD